MYQKKSNIGLYIIIAVVIVALGLVLPGQWEHNVKVPAMIIPQKEWVMLRETDGSIRTIERDYLDGGLHRLQSYKVDRGDHMQFWKNGSITSGSVVEEGDTLGIIRSRRLNRAIRQIRRELSVAKEDLKMRAAGEKPALVEEAEARVEEVQQRLQLLRQLLDRQEKLFEEELISQQQIDSLRIRLKILQSQLHAEQARVEALRSGAKEEERSMLQKRIEGLRKELRLLVNNKKRHTLTIPLNGIFYSQVSADTMFTIKSINKIAVMGLPQSESGRISSGDTVKIKFASVSSSLDGYIHHVEERARPVRGNNLMPVYVTFGRQSVSLPYGTQTETRIMLGTRSSWAYIKQFIKHTFSR